MVTWRPHEDDDRCDATHCRKESGQTHVSKKRAYALCDEHADAGIAQAIADNKEVE